MNNNCIIFFVKYPEKGKVKTRLAKIMGDNITVELYKNFVLDLISTIKNAESAELNIFFSPANKKEKFIQWLGKNYIYKQQVGNDLGEKMKNAFVEVFKDYYKKVVIIGSDSPDLDSDIFNKAFSSLSRNDVVIGPSFDGGYYLIGFNKETFLSNIFDGIKWSRDRVFEDTMNILKIRKYKVSVLEKCHDVDTIDDLNLLFNKNKNTAFKNSKTFLYISKNLKGELYG